MVHCHYLPRIYDGAQITSLPRFHIKQIITVLKKIKQLRYVLIFFLAFFSRASIAQKVLIETDKGNIVVVLNPKAPVTSANFLKYVSAKKYDGAKFYRVVRMNNQPDNKVKIEVIQGGLDEDSTMNFPRIKHESTDITGIKHVSGTLSMARVGPGTAGSEFFICVSDQPELDFGGKRNPDNQGFAAFGQVVSGMDVVKSIQGDKTGTGENIQRLQKPVKIFRMSVIQD